MKKALITSVAGQDGIYLTELLLTKEYEVHGIKRHNSSFNRGLYVTSKELTHTSHTRFHLYYADVTDTATLLQIIQEVEPDEIYNLGAMASTSAPFETSEQIAELNGLHTIRILDAVRAAGLTHKVRIYQNATSTSKESERTYATPKLSSRSILSRYRSTYSMYASNGMVANYELLKRGEIFLPRRIIQGAVRTALGVQGLLYLDSLDTYCDWGHAQDYVEAMWRVLQQPAPADFVIATGIFTTVREFVRLVFGELGIDVVFQGEGVREMGYVAACYNSTFSLMPGQSIVAIDPIYYRPSNVDNYLAEGSKVRRQLGWKPRHNLRTLVQEMVQHDLQHSHNQSSLPPITTPALFSIT